MHLELLYLYAVCRTRKDICLFVQRTFLNAYSCSYGLLLVKHLFKLWWILCLIVCGKNPVTVHDSQQVFWRKNVLMIESFWVLLVLDLRSYYFSFFFLTWGGSHVKTNHLKTLQRRLVHTQHCAATTYV